MFHFNYTNTKNKFYIINLYKINKLIIKKFINKVPKIYNLKIIIFFYIFDF